VVEDDQGRLFLLEKFSRKKYAHRNRVSQAIAHLNQAGFLAALGGHPDLSGRFLSFWGEDCFQISSFLESTGIRRPQWLESSAMGRAMAQCLAGIYQGAAGMDPAWQAPLFSIKSYIYRLFEEMKTHDQAVHDQYYPFLLFLEKTLMDRHDHLTLGFCHGDFHPLNILWDHHRVQAVIDWEFCGLKPDLYDAANLVGCAGIEHPQGLVMPFVTTFLKEIRRARVIDPESWDVFPAYVLALRFAWLSEWLRKKDWEMVEMEAAFMEILVQNRDDLKAAWQMG
jgi:homoserine kinase type II